MKLHVFTLHVLGTEYLNWQNVTLYRFKVYQFIFENTKLIVESMTSQTDSNLLVSRVRMFTEMQCTFL